VARQRAAEGVDYQRFLLRLTELELLDRERRATERRIHQAGFPVVKSLDTFEFPAIPSLNKARPTGAVIFPAKPRLSTDSWSANLFGRPLP